MINIKHKGILFSYDETTNEVLVDGKKDGRNVYIPSFVDNGPGEKPTFIGITNTKTGIMISINGKEFSTVKESELTL